jgi:hypothetical protein
MHWVSEQFVPRLLTDDQKLQRFFICEILLQRANDSENLFIISVKKLVYSYDVETKQ